MPTPVRTPEYEKLYREIGFQWLIQTPFERTSTDETPGRYGLKTLYQMPFFKPAESKPYYLQLPKDTCNAALADLAGDMPLMLPQSLLTSSEWQSKVAELGYQRLLFILEMKDAYHSAHYQLEAARNFMYASGNLEPALALSPVRYFALQELARMSPIKLRSEITGTPLESLVISAERAGLTDKQAAAACSLLWKTNTYKGNRAKPFFTGMSRPKKVELGLDALHDWIGYLEHLHGHAHLKAA